MNNTLKDMTMISFNCKSVKRCASFVRQLCIQADIIALQETWLLPHDLPFMQTIHSDFGCAAKSSVDTSKGVLRGRPYGGVALLWNKSKLSRVTIVECQSDRIVGIRVQLAGSDFLIFSVYMPTDDVDNLSEFTTCMAMMNAIRDDIDIPAMYILGDFNAHPSACFGQELFSFCEEQDWVCADVEKLGVDSDTYTFVSEAHGSTRWLDHCVTTKAAWATVASVDVMYDVSWSDHFPLQVCCKVGVLTNSVSFDGVPKQQISYKYNNLVKWGVRSKKEVQTYYENCNAKLVNINDRFTCNYCDNNIKCIRLKDHFEFIERLYTSLVSVLQVSAKISANARCKPRKNSCKKEITGWNLHVKDIYYTYRQHFLCWVSSGKPNSGILYENMCESRKIFKNKIKWCQKNEESVKLNILATHHKNKNFMKFWKEIKKFNYQQCIPETINGVNDHKLIANLFASQFQIKPLPVGMPGHPVNSASPSSDNSFCSFSPQDIKDIVLKMSRGKSPGHDLLSIEHILCAGSFVYDKLSILFNACFRYGYLPSDLMRSSVIPIPKNKTGDLGDSTNYRPISLGTVIGKILERLLQPELLKYIKVDDAQFGFRPGLSTDSAIFSLKQIVGHYTSRETSVYACFLDLSRAFDLVNYDILWSKLACLKVPPELLNLLRYWYDNQTNNVRWGDTTSNNYKLECGVRQGGLTSPDLFNAYINDLIVGLRQTKVGCHIGGLCVNSLSYADDMVLLSPSIRGLRKLLSVCEDYANAHGLKYNVKKTEMMVFRAGKGPRNVPNVFLNGSAVRVVDHFRYLGHIMSGDLRDDRDMERERRALAVRCNMLGRRFRRSSKSVRTLLFKTFCQGLYTCQLWTSYLKKSYNAIRVQYNDAFRILMGLPRYCSASGMFAAARVPDFFAVLRSRVASFWQRLSESSNEILKVACEGFAGSIFRHWRSLHQAVV